MKLSSVFSDGLILQRDEPNKIWGYTKAFDSVEVKLTDGLTNTALLMTVADENGYFETEVPPVKAGGPYTLLIKDSFTRVAISDVYFGDVFLLTGQSNMELPISRTLDETEGYIKTVSKPLIRQFEVPKDTDFFTEVDELSGGRWAKAEGEDIYNFSAAGYFFAEYLQAETGVPIGLYQTACGGIQTEALISEGRLNKVIPRLKAIAEAKGETKEKNCTCGKNNYCKFCIEEKMFADKDEATIKAVAKEEARISSEFYSWLYANDEGIKNSWEKKSSLYEATEAPSFINVPARWENMPEYPGIEFWRGSVWLLKRFDVPAEYAGNSAKLKLGTIIDADETYINGVLVGKTDYRYPPRRYDVPDGLLKAGENILVVRIVASQRTGGTVPEMPYELNIDGGFTVLLNGPYELRKGAVKEYGSKAEVVNMPDPTFYLFRPYGLYNKMIHPLRKFTIKAMLFYQGESNVGRDWDYVELCKEMVAGIRELFGKPELPFVFVNLPYWGQEDDDRGTDKWEKFRLEQKRLLEIPVSAMADIYDLGFKYELHPQNKKSVGRRLYEAYKSL